MRAVCAQSCLTLCGSMDGSAPGSSVHGILHGMKVGVGCHTLLQGTFPTQGSNLGLLHCRQFFFFFFFLPLSHRGSSIVNGQWENIRGLCWKKMSLNLRVLCLRRASWMVIGKMALTLVLLGRPEILSSLQPNICLLSGWEWAGPEREDRRREE